MNKIGEILKRRKKTRKWLAEETGLSEVSVHEYCSQKHQPSLRTLFKMAKALNLKPSSLINNNYKID